MAESSIEQASSPRDEELARETDFIKELQILVTTQEIFEHLRKHNQDPTVLVWLAAQDKAQGNQALQELQELPSLKYYTDKLTRENNPVLQPRYKDIHSNEEPSINLAIVFPYLRSTKAQPIQREGQPPSELRIQEGILVRVSKDEIRIGRADYHQEVREFLGVDVLAHESLRIVEDIPDSSRRFSRSHVSAENVMWAAFDLFNSKFTAIVPPIIRDVAYAPGAKKVIALASRRKKL